MKRSFIYSLILTTSVFNLNAQTTNRNINIDAAMVKGQLATAFNECTSAGRYNEALRADFQRQLRMAKKELGFRYIRMHGLLHDDMGVYSEDKNGKPVYNWQYIDEVNDFLLSIGIRPFLELSFMPGALASGDKTSLWWKANITPPKDYEKWGALIHALVQHFTERYGSEEVKNWYFEVWNEPNMKSIFWEGDQQGYFKLYQVSANAIKAVSKDYRVGGPSSAGNSWIPEFIQFCSNNKVPVDFISTHTYGVDGNFISPAEGMATYMSKRTDAISGDMKQSRTQINGSSLPKLPLHYTEWNSSFAFDDPVHDSYHQAAYILDKIKKVGNAVQSMSYWTFTDIVEENGPRTTPFHGGFGLINYQDIKKPAYYAYQFLNRLARRELENNDAASWACMDGNGGVQVLLWDFTPTNTAGTISNQVFYKKDNVPAKAAKAVISLRNMAAGKYDMKVYKTGYRVNDAFTSYLDMGSPGQLTRQQVLDIKGKNNGEAVSTNVVSIRKGGASEYTLDLNENDVVLVTLTKL